MKVLGVIPARGGSKGIPRKNVKLLGGKPLIYYTINEALKSSRLDQLILSTEDEEIAEVGGALGASVPFLRPKELAGDKVPTIEVLIHLVDELERAGTLFDAICLLQPTTPFRKGIDIDNAVDLFEKQNTDSLISVLPVPHEFNPHWVFEERDNVLHISTGDKQIIPRRQDLPKAYYRNGAIYLTKISVIKNKKSLYGSSIGYYEMDNKLHVNIDTIKDWQRAEELVNLFYA